MSRRARARALAAAAVLAVLLPACGYRIVGMGGQLPGGISRVEVPIFDNRTPRAEIGRLLSESFIGELLASGKVHVSKEGAQGLIQGTVTVYRTDPITFDAKKKPLANRLTLAMDASLVTMPDRRVLFAEKGVTVRVDYQVKEDLQENDKLEDEARRSAVREMSQKLISLMLEGF